MQVTLKTIMAGPGGCYQPGQTVDLPEPQALELVRTGSATPVSGSGSPGNGRAAKQKVSPPPVPEKTGSRKATQPAETGPGAGEQQAAAVGDTTPSIPDLPFADFGVPAAVAKKLQAAGLESSHDLALMRDDLESIDGIGESTAQMLRELLDDLAPAGDSGQDGEEDSETT